MISLAVIESSSDAARYHDSALSQDGNAQSKEADNYYVNEKALATWEGQAAAILGIEGREVEREDFINLLDGKITNPKDGVVQDLANNSKGKDRRLGYDFTVSAPKTVSMVGLIGGDQRIIEAHKAANATALGWLEKHGAQIRVKDEDGNNRPVQTGNLLYATVQHDTSRTNDPQIHNHNVIVAVTYDHEAAKWRSLTNDELFKLRTTADAIYKNELAVQLKAAGYQLEFAENGIDFDIKGITAEQKEVFSERSAQMREALIQRGIDPDTASYEARQTAVLDSRAAKTAVTRSELVEMWGEMARDAGLDIKQIVADALENSKNGVLPELNAKEVHQAVSLAIEHLSEREQAFKKAELEAAAVRFGTARFSLEAIQASIRDNEKNKILVTREGAATSSGGPMYTTSAAISQEMILQHEINSGKGKGALVLRDANEFDSLLSVFEARKSQETNSQFKLSGEQVNAAKNVLMHPDKYQGIQGDAGTGKTAALEFVREAALMKGWDVRGIATSSTGATELGKATGIPSMTVAAFLQEKDKTLRMLKADLDKLAVEIANSSTHIARIKQVERRDMNLSGGSANGFGAARYVFDNKNGNVFKSEAGPLNLINKVGHQLSDSGNQSTMEAKANWDKAEKFSERFTASASLAVGTVKTRLGKHLATYEKVGTVEAKAARAAHEAQKDIQQERHNQLVRTYEQKSAQHNNLTKTGNIDGKKFLLVMDESSMTGTQDSARISEIARDLGARVVLQGDIKQHGSVAAGRAFEQTHDAGIHLSKIEETRRFDNATIQTKRAIAEMKQGNYAGALSGLDTTVVSSLDDLYATVADRFMANRAELKEQGHLDPKVGIVTITNADRKSINVAVREALKTSGEISKTGYVKEHLNDPKLTKAEKKHVPTLQEKKIDRLTALRDYKKLGVAKEEMLKVLSYERESNTLLLRKENGAIVSINPERMNSFSYTTSEKREYAVGDKVEARANIGKRRDPDRITNGMRGTVVAIDAEGATVRWDSEKQIRLTNAQLRHLDHAYAHTSYKEQGVTTQREIVAVSQTGASIFNRYAAYVAASRAKDNTEIVTNALDKMLKNAGQDTAKTTAIDIGKDKGVDLGRSKEQSAEIPVKEHSKDKDMSRERSKDRGYVLER